MPARFRFITVVSIMFLAGCAGNESYRSSRAFLAEGNYDQAVEELRKAVAREPNNTSYRISLAEAESLAADKHVEQAERLFAEKQASAARRELQIALDQVPAHPRGILLIRTVENQIARCDELVEQARAALAEKDCARARRLAQEALALDASHAEAMQVDAQCVVMAVTEHAARAEQALEDQRWSDCAAACSQILAVDPSNEAAAALARQAEDRQEALHLVERAAPLDANGDYIGAAASLARAAELWPDNETIRARLTQVTQAAASQVADRVDKLLAAGEFAAAVKMLDDVTTGHPQPDNLRQRRAHVLQAWAAALLDAFERHAMAGEWALAWPLAVQAMAVTTVDAPRPAQCCEQAERMVRRELTRTLNVVPLESATAGQGVAGRLAHAMAEEVATLAPPHVTVVGPAAGGEHAREQTLALDRVAEPEPLAELARTLGEPDAILFIDVVVDEHTDQQAQRYPVHQDQRQATARLRLRLIDVPPARIVWSDDELTATSSDSRRLESRRHGDEADTPAAKRAGDPRADAVDRLAPQLHAKARQMLNARAAAHVAHSGGEPGPRPVAGSVRCLFDAPVGADPLMTQAAMDHIFDAEKLGTYASRCRQIASERLQLDRPVPAAPAPALSEPQVSQGPSQGRTLPEALVQRSPETPPQPRGTGRDRGAERGPDSQTRSVPSIPSTVPAAAPPAAPPPRIPPVYRGTVSRNDDRFPKELRTVDGIVVSVRDTDSRPLDADIEIRVGNRRTRHKDQPVGACIRGRGVSGRHYVITILAIDNKHETVHFSIEPDNLPAR